MNMKKHLDALRNGLTLITMLGFITSACSSSDDSPASPDGGANGSHDAGNTETDSGASSGGSDQVVGTFTITSIAPTDTEPDGHTTVLGKVYDGPTPSQVVWEAGMKSGSCQLSTPRVPFCNTPCGGSAVCVEDDQCQAYPTAHDVGAVKVSGVKTSAGASEFTMNPISNTYQPSGDTKLPFPAFAEGDAISVSAAGGDYKAFTIEAHGVGTLKLGKDTYALERNKELALTWTAGKSASASVHVKLDISHHGGTKGMIECDTSDSGSLSIGADLIGALLDLGVAGFPTIVVTRHDDGTASIAPGKVQLTVVSSVETAVTVPGLSSCSGDSECPSGQKCQADLTCK
jgi:hypothetical protein